MWSKLSHAPGLLRFRKVQALQTFQKVQALQKPVLRQLSLGFPKQYQQPASAKFRLFHVLRYHWELSPLLFCIVFDLFIISAAIYYGFTGRVDIQLTGHHWNCISRNMDLRNPTIHKHLTFNQQYEPWPRMQHVMDKMAEKEAELNEITS